MIARYLDLSALVKKGHSAFLFGPRSVGKTLLVEKFVKDMPSVVHLDLLNHDVFQHYLTRPTHLYEDVRQRLESQTEVTVFIDEVQKLPALLDEVHRLMTAYGDRLRFLLTGSNARKLKRGGANLLAGRAATLHLHPLSTWEVNIDLRRALRGGTLPKIYLESADTELLLKAYVDTYLKEEVFQEALVRRIESFHRFIELAGQYNGEPVNYTAIAKASRVAPKTVQEFFSILEDTLVVFRIDGWSRSVRKQLLQSPKYYWFDCGVLNALRGELKDPLKESSFRYGRLFETFLLQEAVRLNDYSASGYRMAYWRTNTGMEVDLLLYRGYIDPPTAIEIKSGSSPEAADVRGLLSFQSENPAAALYCFCQTPKSYSLGPVRVLPWREGLDLLFKREDHSDAPRALAV